MRLWMKISVAVGVVVGSAIVGLLSPGWFLGLGTIAIAKGIAVLGMVPLFRASLIPFGNALYYCIAGYVAGLATLKFQIVDAGLLVVLGACLAGMIAAILGFLMRRYREIFFAMLSLAFSMLLYGILVKSAALGSTDGFNVPPPRFFTFKFDGHSTQVALFVYTCLWASIAAILVDGFLGSVWGQTATAIRDNEIRVEYLGSSASKSVHIMYILAGVLGGIGGSLTALAVGHVDPSLGYWTTSGELVFVTILSGTGGVVAPFLGAILFEAIHTLSLDYSPEAWRILLGTSLLGLIIFMPGGLSSVISKLRGM